MRNPVNTNQNLWYDGTFMGLTVHQWNGPLVQEYLERLYGVMDKSLKDYSRVFAIRVDPRFPVDYEAYGEVVMNDCLSRFIESFKAKIEYNRELARRGNSKAHDTVVRYVWAREYSESGRPHYHLVFLLNGHAFSDLGYFEYGRDNMFNRLHQAWASALGIPLDQAKGLVHFPDEGAYLLHRDRSEMISAFFERATYLCKADTKHFGNGLHGFGASRC